MKIHNVEQGSDEWLQLRVGKFTASSFYKFLGKSRQTEIYKKAAERITQTRCDSEIFSNKHMERGNELEEEARLMYELLHDQEVEEVGFIELDDDTGCSPDGLVGADGIIEIKCRDNHKFLETKLKGVSSLENKQIQFNLYVSNRKWCDYIAYNPNFKTSIFVKRIERDEVIVNEIINCIKECNIKINEIIKEI